MKIVILILANDTNGYLKMQELWRKYMNTHSNITSYFMKYKNDLSEDVVVVDDTIYVKGNESLIPGCLDKTIKSIEYILKMHEFDFIFRTNMSSVIDLNLFYDALKIKLKDNSKCAGIIGYHKGQPFISGAGMLLSKYVCDLLTSNKHILNYSIIDDVSIGSFLLKNKIKMDTLTRFEVYNYENTIDLLDRKSIENYYHFRCKSNSNNQEITAKLMNKIIELISY